MAYLNKSDPPRLSAPPFLNIQGILGLPDIERGPPSAGATPAGSPKLLPTEPKWRPDLAEPCFITKSVSYTHEPFHWIRVDRYGGRSKEEIETHMICLGITGPAFDVDNPNNITNLDCNLVVAMETYAFIAVTPSLSTLNQLISMIQADNDLRQKHVDEHGIDCGRRFLLFENPGFRKPEYELVVLHPEHFLPLQTPLAIYNDKKETRETYARAEDRVLRRVDKSGTIEPNAPQLPPFSFDSPRGLGMQLNPFFVVINAEIKFQEYLTLQPPPAPLAESVQTLMRRTIELVELLYWLPTPPEGSLAALLNPRKTNVPSEPEPEPIEIDDDSKTVQLSNKEEHRETRRESRNSSFMDSSMDLEARMEAGRALLSDRNLPITDYDRQLMKDLGLPDPDS